MEPFTAALLAKPAGKLAAALLRPIYSRLEGELSKQAQLAIHKVFNSYTDYLQQSTQRHSYFNSVVFKNEQRKLVDYYQPLTLLETRSKRELLINCFPAEEIAQARNVLIVDTAGMGKTTLLKLMFLKCAQEEKAVPIFVELRKLSRKQKLSDYIQNLLSDLDGSCKPQLFFKLLSKGGFCIFLDGYDEIPDSERTAVTASIQQFIEKAPENAFIMTSRDEAGLAAFAQFQRYTIKPLRRDEAYSLLRKYADPTLADSLVAKLELPENRAIHEFLTNPLLTSLLFKSFEYKHIIPLKRHIFYRQVYEALYESHDLTKEGGEFQRSKRSGLDIDRFEQLLRAFGAVTYKATKTEFTKDAALAFAGKARDLCSERKASPSSIIHDATHAVPLLVVDGNYIRWSHRSIQEYFAAQYLCKNTDGRHIEVLLGYFNGEGFRKHTNLILLAADIDRAAFDRSIGKHIARLLLNEHSTIYREEIPGVGADAIERRKCISVGRVFYVVNRESPHGSNREANEMYQHLHLKMVAHAAIPESTGSTIMYGRPGIGAIATKLQRFLQEAKGRLEFTFIEDSKITVRPVPSAIGPWPTDELLRVTDDPASPLNTATFFEATTSLMERAMEHNWRFNPELARTYIDEVEASTRNLTESQPW
jgi:predicted NACHT family NTPase